jgi:hypothetical protein
MQEWSGCSRSVKIAKSCLMLVHIGLVQGLVVAVCVRTAVAPYVL